MRSRSALHRLRHTRVNKRVFILIFLAIILSLVFYKSHSTARFAIEGVDEWPAKTGEGGPWHYKYLVVIASPALEFTRRNLIRQMYFGLNDNIEPCMQDNTDTKYLFWVYGEPIARKTAERRQYEAERMEWNDIEEVRSSVWFEQHSVIDWAESEWSGRGFTYDYLIVQHIDGFVQLSGLKDELSSTKSTDVVWGSFTGQETDKYVFAIGSTAAKQVLQLWHTTYNKEGQNLLTSIHLHYQDQGQDSTGPTFLRKDVLFYNAKDEDGAPTEEHRNIVAATHVHQDDTFANLARITGLEPSEVCRGRQSIALMTSSYIYPDNCMEPSARLSAMNKRIYAERHHISFVPRSTEFAQQRGRKTVWGKIDAVQNVLPHYDWIFWTDMDCVIMDSNRSLRDLLNDLRAQYPGGVRAFDKNVDLIVSRPPRDPMLNAGVFFMRNSEWSMQFLKEVQESTEWYNKRPAYEQGAMAEVSNKTRHQPHVYLLYPDVHTFNTFPQFYQPGDFIVHYAPDGCPNDYVLQGLDAAERIRDGETITKLYHGKSGK
ncbi:galactosyl transferase GMA12/MNN10 family-domain-containing protein [Fennellomyces sp. T-0311]|nr:galactosyl transferase GMA12/MNN10 family-domain-containing protein [Fennellomyces sp. T-0311]